MSSWAGFSDEELRKIQHKDSPGPAAAARGRRAAPAHRSRPQVQREKALQLAAQRSHAVASNGLQPEQQLDKPANGKVAPSTADPAVKETDQPEPSGVVEQHQPPAEEPSPGVKELEKEEVELREKTRLERLQQEQKVIEEKNKRTKALLAKTIAEKSKQTQEEAVKLRRIQKELQALDDMVSSDISILRDRIEQASWDYSAARKRYERAESEYVTAKLDLHRKTEAKEQLTEHLYAIIQQNELRKAEKLQELMLQLHAAEASEDRDAPAEDPQPPTGCPADCLREGTVGEESGEGGGAKLPAETQQEALEGEASPPDGPKNVLPPAVEL